MSIDLVINEQAHSLELEADVPLLWALRDVLGLTGTKFGCGIGLCGACTVHVDGAPQRSCSLPLAAVAGRRVTTIEALGQPAPHALQRAWVALQVPQCGYCQSGMLMAAAALLATTPRPSDADIDRAVTNLCRCGAYERIRRAIHRAAGDGTS